MAKRKAPPRASKKDPYSLEQLLTSEKSKLIDIDLHGMLADFFTDPDNWAQVSAEDKDFIRTLLPPHVELTDDGSVPSDFWNYNPEFRLDCRNLQEDLRTGRMDPEWQVQAHQAMEERATGAFDTFKEREFEEYWGQKQKVDSHYLAGDASKIKLEELLDAGLFREGDVWSFDHTFGRGDEAVTIQKDCKIMNINGKSVTFAIPPGQLRFARVLDHQSAPQNDQKTTPPLSTPAESTANPADAEVMVDGPLCTVKTAQENLEPTSLVDRSKPLDRAEDQDASTAVAQEHGQPDYVRGDIDVPSVAVNQAEDEASDTPPTSRTPNRRHEETTIQNSSQASSPLSELESEVEDSSPTSSDCGIIQFTISTLFPLEKKIIEVDGRLPPTTRTASTWRDIRCRRNEQDMGSLFEMRDEYFAYRVAGKHGSSHKAKRS
ncbi:MAG: hypothetical protein Q9204_004507 [Flavoplaca sp. TL-2023a]